MDVVLPALGAMTVLARGSLHNRKPGSSVAAPTAGNARNARISAFEEAGVAQDEPESARGRAGVPREKYSYPAAGAGGADPPALHTAGEVPPGRGPTTLRVGALLLAAGGWLLLAPSALSYAAAVATASDMITGGLLAVVALAALVAPARMRWLGLVAAAFGAWVVLAPFVLFYAAGPAGDDAIWNDLVVGPVVIVLGLIGTLTRRAAV